MYLNLNIFFGKKGEYKQKKIGKRVAKQKMYSKKSKNNKIIIIFIEIYLATISRILIYLFWILNNLFIKI